MADTIPARIQKVAEQLAATPSFLKLLLDDSTEQTLSYSNLLIQSLRWTALYEHRGLRPGDKLVIILEQSVDLYASYLGAVLGGYIPTFFAPLTAKTNKSRYLADIQVLIANSQASLVVLDPHLTLDLAHAIDSARIVHPAALPNQAASFPSVPVDPNSVAFIQYSSGTTGLKKGVPITHAQLLLQLDTYSAAIELTPSDRIISWLPLYHDMGLIACFWMPLLKGISLTACSPIHWVTHPQILLQLIEQEKSTLCWLPNFAYLHLCKIADQSPHDLSSLRGITNCSEPILASTHEKFLSSFSPQNLRPSALWTCYAMAEAVFAVTCSRPGHPPRVHQGVVSSGFPLPGFDVRIVDGAIWLKGPCLLKSYYRHDKDPFITDDAGERWYVTGDLGFLSEGELFVTGRADDLIILGGRNIYPQDIEAIVNTIPGVIPGRCVAVGQPNKGSGTQELLILAETHLTDPIDRSRLCDDIAEATSAQRVVLKPHMWLAKSSSGKLSRKANVIRHFEECRDLSLLTPDVMEGRPRYPLTPGLEIRVLDPEDNELVPGYYGVVLIRPKRGTESQLPDHKAKVWRGEKWVYTGDLGGIDNDELVQVGTKDQAVNLHGSWYLLTHLERLLATVEGVHQERVAVLPHPNGTLVIIAECEKNPEDHRKRLIEAIPPPLLASVADVRCVPPLWLVDTRKGAESRHENFLRYEGLIHTVEPETPTETRVRAVISEFLSKRGSGEGSAIGIDSALIRSGRLDSLGIAQMILTLEDALGRPLPSFAQVGLDAYESVRSIARLVDAPLQAVSVAHSSAALDPANDRDRKTYHYLQGTRDHGMLILGSSRVRSLNSEKAGLGYKSYNYSVGSAQAEDAYCILQFLQEHWKSPPQVILLGIDVEAFTDYRTLDIRLANSHYLAPYVSRLDPWFHSGPQHRDALVAPQIEERALQILNDLRMQHGDPDGLFRYETEAGDFVLTGDNEHAKVYEARKPLTIVDPQGGMSTLVLRLRGFEKLQSERLEVFRSLLSLCEAEKIRIITFTTPVHAQVEAYLKETTNYSPRLNELNAWIAATRAQDSYGLWTHYHLPTPASFGGSDVDFCDGTHIGAYNSDLLVRHLLTNDQIG